MPYVRHLELGYGRVSLDRELTFANKFPCEFDLVLAQHYIDNDWHACEYIIICIPVDATLGTAIPVLSVSFQPLGSNVQHILDDIELKVDSYSSIGMEH